MTKDIVPELLEKLENEFVNKYSKNKKINSAVKKIKTGKATHKDSNEFAYECGKILAEVFKENISTEDLPDGKMYYNIADRVLNDTLGRNYKLISDYSADVQTSLNKSSGLRIKGLKPPKNQDRINGLIEKVQEKTYEETKWVLQEPIINFSQSIIDDTIKTNVDFHNKLGLRPKIVRKMNGKCCDWCKEVEGEYKYPNVPKDVFRRHRFCRCTVEYFPGDGRKQNVHTKKWQDIDAEEKLEIRKQFNTNYSNINYKKADEKIEQSLQIKSDKVWENKLLGSEQNAIYEYSGDYYGITNRYLRDELLPDDDIEWSQTPQRIKEMDRALSKNKLGDDLVLYRGVSEEEYNAWLNNEFLQSYKSTSISENTFEHFGDGHRIIIHAPKNTKGFYIGKHSAFKDEKEFLIHRGQKYKILSNRDGILEVEIIG